MDPRMAKLYMAAVMVDANENQIKDALALCQNSSAALIDAMIADSVDTGPLLSRLGSLLQAMRLLGLEPEELEPSFYSQEDFRSVYEEVVYPYAHLIGNDTELGVKIMSGYIQSRPIEDQEWMRTALDTLESLRLPKRDFLQRLWDSIAQGGERFEDYLSPGDHKEG